MMTEVGEEDKLHAILQNKLVINESESNMNTDEDKPRNARDGNVCRKGVLEEMPGLELMTQDNSVGLPVKNINAGPPVTFPQLAHGTCTNVEPHTMVMKYPGTALVSQVNKPADSTLASKAVMGLTNYPSPVINIRNPHTPTMAVTAKYVNTDPVVRPRTHAVPHTAVTWTQAHAVSTSSQQMAPRVFTAPVYDNMDRHVTTSHAPQSPVAASNPYYPQQLTFTDALTSCEVPVSPTGSLFPHDVTEAVEDMSTVEFPQPAPPYGHSTVRGLAYPTVEPPYFLNQPTQGNTPLPGQRFPVSLHGPASQTAGPDMSSVRQGPRGSSLKVGRYDGQTSYEAFRAKFDLIALTNGWTEQEKTGQLAASLEGEAQKVLLEAPISGHWNSQALHLALERRFGDVTPATAARQQLQERVRRPGERLGMFLAELRYLAHKGFATFTEEVRLLLTKEAFIRGLTPERLRQQVRLSNPATLEDALDQAQVIEEILGEQVPSQPQAHPQAYAVQTREERPSLPTTQRGRAQRSQICWRCGQEGHIRRECTLPDGKINPQLQGNGNGSA